MKINRRDLPCGGSMYEILSVIDGYDEITKAAMELVIEEGVDALMYQLNYDDIENVKMYPSVYERAIELGIIEADEDEGEVDE